MRIPILILGFKGLRLQEGMTNIPDRLLFTDKKTVDIMFVTVIHKGTNKKSFIYSAVSLTNKFQQNLMNVPNYYKHSTYQNGKENNENKIN